MKRNRATPKLNPKKICTLENEKNDGRNGSTSSKDTLRVFCRVRPLQSDHEVSCITIVPPNKIQVKSPDANRVGNFKETQYTFNSVFDQTTSQHDIFMNTSYDLVKSLINGKNGLLFAYGITGSGKTYTMNGTHDNVGIMPRCLDVLFNSIHGYQPRKYVFKPDRMNGFDVQSEPDAMLDRQRELSNIKTPSRFYRKESDQEMMSRKGTSSLSSSETNKIKIDDVVKENSYAVFVTYVEIYNNSVYDLMEEYPDDMTRQRPMQPKLIREDGTRNMYVHAVTEVEVQSAEEAFDVYSKGQKRRRLAYTALNTESSRSHSVFTIRLVQAPLNLQGDFILKDRMKLNISQLSLVDLAGSERTSRTKTAGQRLREAGSINNSLLTLRTCLEILRENQLHGTNKMVPYRESRLTHLFKNYFDGEGDIRMIVCINPRTDDYDETLHVLKFSEMSQEVQINRPAPPKITETPRRVYIPETPSSRRANHAFKQTVAKLEAEGIPSSRPTPIDANVIIRTSTHFPDFLKWEDAHDIKLNNDLKAVLQLQRQRSLDYIDRGEKIVRKISEAIEEKERDFVSNKNEIKHLNNAFNKERNKCLDLERRIMEIESKNSELQMKLISTENIVKSLENEVTEKEQQLSNEQIQVALQKNRFKNKLAQSKEKLAKEMEMKLQEQKSAMEYEMMERDRIVQRRVRRALDTGTSSCTAIIHSAPRSGRPHLLQTPSSKPMKSGSDSSSTPVFNRLRKPLQTVPLPQSATSVTGSKSVECALDLATPVTVRENRRPQTVAVSNPRHRRSRSAGGGERWLDHCPITSAVPLNTVMQPVMKRRKSITKLTDVKDVANSKVSKYCLTTQTLDSDGDLETCLYKGDIIPTIGGGAQVSFNDMEVLNHKSPQSSPTKSKATPCKSPRTPLIPRGVLEERCAVSYEGHTKRSAI